MSRRARASAASALARGAAADKSPRDARPRRAGGSPRQTVAERVLSDDAGTLLDVVDHALTKGVVLTGDVTIALAHVDLIYARLSLLLCAADQVMPGEDPDPIRRRQDRRAARRRRDTRG
jgi:hypothetical protein